MGSYHHVAYQDGDLSYFVPTLFKYGLFNNLIAYMLIADLLYCIRRSKYVCANHYSNRISCLFWKNHPIETICVVGFVMGFRWKWINNVDFVLLTVDDFSSRTDCEQNTLVCKCSQTILLSSGLSTSDLAGKRLRLYGYINLRYGELETTFVESCEDLTLEIDHWMRCLTQREKFDAPWEISRQVLQETFTQESEIDQEDPEVTTPIRRRAKEEFVEGLLNEKYKEELEIVSPYKDSSSSENESFGGDQTFWPPTRRPKDSLERKELLVTSTQNLVRNASVDCMWEMKSIFTRNETQARTQLLRYLLTCSHQTISIVELYQISQVNDIIDDVSTVKFHQQNLMHIKPFEQLKTEIFFELIRKLVTSGLLAYINHNLVELSPLKKLHAYCSRRLLALIKLQCYSGAIDTDHIREKLHLPSVSQEAIIEIFKEALKATARKYSCLIKGWWIEVNTEKSSLIHLEYHEINKKVL